MTAPSPFATGLSGRCPKCGEGALFDGFLKIARQCDVCGQSFENADVGDGAAVFVMFIAGFLIILPALILFRLVDLPVYVHLIIWTPLVIIVTMALLRPAKGLLYALQFAHGAEEGRFED